MALGLGHHTIFIVKNERNNRKFVIKTTIFPKIGLKNNQSWISDAENLNSWVSTW